MHALESVERLERVLVALDERHPLPAAPLELSVEMCREDDQGAWAYWTDAVEYVPESDDRDVWRSARRVRLARVSLDGQVTLARELPAFFDPPPQHKRFPSVADANCCYAGYGVGAPVVSFIGDQTGDGVPEIALRAEWAVEGAFHVAAIVYEFDGQQIREQRLDFDAAEDVDKDGVFDLIFTDLAHLGEACDTGFPEMRASGKYIGRGKRDGSFSFDHEVARAFSRKQCPEAPKAIASALDIWCAKLWGRDAKWIDTEVRRGCAADPRGVSSLPDACAWLEPLVSGFEPKLRLKPWCTQRRRHAPLSRGTERLRLLRGFAPLLRLG